MKNSVIIVLFFLCSNIICLAQRSGETYNSMTLFLVDNSSGYKAPSMNEELTEELKSLVGRMSQKSNNYFFFYGANGEEPLNSANAGTLVSGNSLRSYLNKESKESDNLFDLKMLRQFILYDKVVIKQNLEIYLFLSDNAVKRMIKNPDELPSFLLFCKEAQIYLTEKELNTKINFFLNKDVVKEFPEKTLTNFFNFCADDINTEKPQYSINLF
ncbi:MAG: hypothetical protein ACK5P4_04140 [Bacteroidota bacterium]